MTWGKCTREAEVKSLLDRGHWPQACGPDLRAHVEDCRACSDVVLLTQAFRTKRANASIAARLEPSGVLWWRAQLRRRNAAIERIGKPLLGAQIFAVTVSLLAASLFLIAQARRDTGWLSWFQQLPRSLHLEVLLPDTLQKSQGQIWLFISLAGLLALTSGVIMWFASEKR
ncbi:MAG TPA: hypothetical protein VGG85_15485 [Terracidiphilus sp.]|jgi:hypothetical protein